MQKIIKQNAFGESDRTYMQDIGLSVDQLIDQVNELGDQQDKFVAKLSKIQRKQAESPVLTLPSLKDTLAVNTTLLPDLTSQPSRLPELLKQPSPLTIDFGKRNDIILKQESINFKKF